MNNVNKGVYKITQSETTGCISISGIRRYPISLYENEWKIIIKLVKDGHIERFIEQLNNNLQKENE